MVGEPLKASDASLPSAMLQATFPIVYTVWMYSKVKPLRTRGKRSAERDIHTAKPQEGIITMFMCGGAPELKLSAKNDSTATPLIPVLYEARLTTMHGNKMLFKGIEKDSSGAEYVQEWSVQIGD